MRKRTLLVGFAVLGLLLSPVDGAEAKKKRTNASTILTIDQASGTNIRGDLASSSPRCVENRVVDVTRDGGVAVGQTTTDGNGQWTIATDPVLAQGEVVTARAQQVVYRVRRKRTVCASDTDIFTVGAAGGTNQTLNVTNSSAGGSTGTITSSPAGIDCTTAAPNDCTEDYATGTDVTLTATPGANSVFVNWVGCDATSGNQCTLRMNGTRNVTAAFNSTAPPATPPDECAPTGTLLDPVLCIVTELLSV